MYNLNNLNLHNLSVQSVKAYVLTVALELQYRNHVCVCVSFSLAMSRRSMRLLTSDYYRTDGEMNERSSSHQVSYRETPVRCVYMCVCIITV